MNITLNNMAESDDIRDIFKKKYDGPGTYLGKLLGDSSTSFVTGLYSNKIVLILPLIAGIALAILLKLF